MMVRCKKTYSRVRQYVPKKPQKWGLKVWCLADSVTKYVYNLEFYTGKDSIVMPSIGEIVELGPTVGEANLAYNVVMRLCEGFENVGHCLTIDNYFSSI